MTSKYSSIHVLLQDGRSALHWASYKGHVKVVEVLLDAGAKVNLIDKVRLYVYMCVFCRASVHCTNYIHISIPPHISIWLK